MEAYRLEDMVGGWFVGAFTPAAVGSEAAEVAVKRYAAGDHEELHHHKLAVEATLIVSGRVRMAGAEWGEGDIIVLQPGEATAFDALTDVTNVVVKLPSVLGDKYPGLP